MDWITVVYWLLVFAVGYLAASALVLGHTNKTIKQENERLNEELKSLTDRDSRGRFIGKKK